MTIEAELLPPRRLRPTQQSHRAIARCAPRSLRADQWASPRQVIPGWISELRMPLAFRVGQWQKVSSKLQDEGQSLACAPATPRRAAPRHATREPAGRNHGQGDPPRPADPRPANRQVYPAHDVAGRAEERNRDLASRATDGSVHMHATE
jgi:hypothetical protein